MRKLSQELLSRIDKWNNQKFKMESFKIDVEFIIGRMGNEILNFDGTIYWYAMLYLLQKNAFDINVEFFDAINIELPIQKKYFETECGKDYFYNISGIYSLPRKVNFYTKRFCQDNLKILTDKRIQINGNLYKNGKTAFLYDNIKHYTIYGIGDIERLKQIMPKYNFIGKKYAIGFGECEIKYGFFNVFML